MKLYMKLNDTSIILFQYLLNKSKSLFVVIFVCNMYIQNGGFGFVYVICKSIQRKEKYI